jgi:predicted methyltransferase
MRSSTTKLLCGAAMVAGLALVTGRATTAVAPGYIKAAIDNPNRPDVDKARDAGRKTAETIAFAGIHPGQKVIELIPGPAFYFTKVLANVVGPTGHVYAASPGPNVNAGSDTMPPKSSLTTNPAFANVSDVVLPSGLPAVAPVDVVWTAQNYHDFHLARLNVNVPATDKLIFSLRKPGGEFIVIDHSALAGSGLDVPDKLHRINEDIVKQEVESAGFVLEAESDVLRNPADPRTALVFDASIRGHTDQFVLRFRKPK